MKKVEAVTLIVHEGKVYPAAYVVGEGWYRGPEIFGAESPMPRLAYEIHLGTVTTAIERHGIDGPAFQLHGAEVSLLEVTEPPVAEAVCGDNCNCGISCEDYDEQWDELRYDR